MVFIKGHIPWDKGKTRSDYVKKRLREVHLGTKLSEETKRKISIANKGKKLSKEHRIKIGKANKGKTRSTESLKRMSDGQKKTYRDGRIVWNKGRKLNGEERKKILVALQKHRLLKQPTSIENIVYKELQSKGIYFERQKLINDRFLVDAYIPSLNLIIEVDGNYWHNLDRVKRKDKAENAYLKKCGYNLLRLSEKEISDLSFRKKLSFD